MSKANIKSTRLLIEMINREMESVRKAAMGNMAVGSLNELRDLVGQLAKKAERIALEDLSGMADEDPAEYVAAMMPFVAEYHRQLAPRDLLASCLCRDLRVPACVVIIVGDQGSRVRAAHDPNRPDAVLIVETLLASLDEGTKKVAAEAAAAKEQLERGLVGVDLEASEVRQEAVEPAPESPRRIRFVDQITDDDRTLVLRADFVIDCDDIVIKDHQGAVGRVATQDEIDGCVIVKDPGSGVGMGDDE